MSDGNRCAVVTGAAGGIGWAICEDLAANGWSVAAADVDARSVADRAGSGSAYLCLELDVTDTESVEAGVTACVERFGRIDLLVNNAGIGRLHAIEDLDVDGWRAVLDVNLDGAYRCLRVAGRHMVEAGAGAVVNIASIYATLGGRRRAAYIASKAGLVGLTRAAAVEWAVHGIRVNAVGPGYVWTPPLERYASKGEVDVEPIVARVPLGRLGQPEDIARAVRFLGSDEAAYITGQVLYVDGGLLVEPGFE